MERFECKFFTHDMELFVGKTKRLPGDFRKRRAAAEALKDLLFGDQRFVYGKPKKPRMETLRTGKRKGIPGYRPVSAEKIYRSTFAMLNNLGRGFISNGGIRFSDHESAEHRLIAVEWEVPQSEQRAFSSDPHRWLITHKDGELQRQITRQIRKLKSRRFMVHWAVTGVRQLTAYTFFSRLDDKAAESVRICLGQLLVRMTPIPYTKHQTFLMPMSWNHQTKSFCLFIDTTTIQGTARRIQNKGLICHATSPEVIDSLRPIVQRIAPNPKSQVSEWVTDIFKEDWCLWVIVSEARAMHRVDKILVTLGERMLSDGLNPQGVKPLLRSAAFCLVHVLGFPEGAVLSVKQFQDMLNIKSRTTIIKHRQLLQSTYPIMTILKYEDGRPYHIKSKACRYAPNMGYIAGLDFMSFD